MNTISVKRLHGVQVVAVKGIEHSMHYFYGFSGVGRGCFGSSYKLQSLSSLAGSLLVSSQYRSKKGKSVLKEV